MRVHQYPIRAFWRGEFQWQAAIKFTPAVGGGDYASRGIREVAVAVKIEVKAVRAGIPGERQEQVRVRSQAEGSSEDAQTGKRRLFREPGAAVHLDFTCQRGKINLAVSQMRDHSGGLATLAGGGREQHQR